MFRSSFATCIVFAVTVILGVVGSAPAQHQVPFKGSLAGLDIGTPIPGTVFASVTINATGNATHLGKFTFAALATINTTTKVGSGTFVFKAANGDTVFGTFSGSGTFAPPNVLTISETAIITGGSGRFAGATGGFSVARVKNTMTGVTTATFTGTISAPGKGK